MSASAPRDVLTSVYFDPNLTPRLATGGVMSSLTWKLWEI